MLLTYVIIVLKDLFFLCTATELATFLFGGAFGDITPDVFAIIMTGFGKTAGNLHITGRNKVLST